MKFRNDINGLRAYAVLLVVLFHFKIPPFSGGFVGVDIFFVISGYLMTRIIIEGLNAESFSLWKFYFSRCKRIIPPLMVLCLILLVLGYYFIPPSEYETLSKHVLASITFTSNMVYYTEAGYFDAGAVYKWLLHTWSLSVEWQFYLALPIFLMLVASFFKGRYKAALIISFVLSLLMALYLSEKRPSLSYFFFGSRAWEMLAGGLAYAYSINGLSDKVRKITTYLCMSVLILSSIFINEYVAWPGLLTIIPVAATAIMIAITGEGYIVNNRVAQKIGAWSYSIYLYHWPILVASGIFVIERTLLEGLSLVALSIFLGWLSYTLLEDKKGTLFTAFSRPGLIFPSAIIIVGVSSALYLSDGIPSHATERVNYISSFVDDKNHDAKKCFVINDVRSPECKFGPAKADDKVDLVVIGDSHAYAVLSAVIASNPAASIVFIAQSGCPPVPGIIKNDRPYCGDFMKNAFSSVRNKYKNASVLIASSLSQYFHGKNGGAGRDAEFSFNNQPGTLVSFISNLNTSLKSLAINRSVFILSPIPDYPYNVVFRMSRNAMLGENTDIKEELAEYKERSDDINAALRSLTTGAGNVQVLNSAEYLCDNNECFGSRNGVPLYSDNNHLSETGNKILLPLFKKMWSVTK